MKITFSKAVDIIKISVAAKLSKCINSFLFKHISV